MIIMARMTSEIGLGAGATKCRWETRTRYYLGQVQENLFGQWELVRFWGGRGNRLGGMMIEPAISRAHALQLLADEGKRRVRRGYAMVSPSPYLGGLDSGAKSCDAPRRAARSHQCSSCACREAVAGHRPNTYRTQHAGHQRLFFAW